VVFSARTRREEGLAAAAKVVEGGVQQRKAKRVMVRVEGRVNEEQKQRRAIVVVVIFFGGRV
jgi:hypothetical protein